MLETIEFFWDERTNTAYYVDENIRTGELTQHSRHQPFPTRGKHDIDWLEPGQDLREKYFAELVTYLKTQDPYGPAIRGEHY